MKIPGLSLLLVSLLISCQQSPSTERYSVKGLARNMPDSTSVILYQDMDTILDSTIVLNEQFQFTGTIERPQRVMLKIISTRDSRMFWLENKEIDIVGEKGKMRNSTVSGSHTQEEAELLLTRKNALYHKMDSITQLVTDSNRDSLFVIYDQMIVEEVNINQQFIQDFPDSYESLVILNNSKERLGAEVSSQLLSLMNPEFQTTEEGKAITRFTEVYQNPQVGEQYVDFEQTNPQGQSIRFSDVKGKYTLLEFWSSTCGPCRAFNPELVQEYERYKEKGFVVLGVSLDSQKKNWIQAIEKDGLPWENVSDLKGVDNQVAMIYGVSDIPDNFLIDDKGTIIARYITGNQLKEKLEGLFAD